MRNSFLIWYSKLYFAIFSHLVKFPAITHTTTSYHNQWKTCSETDDNCEKVWDGQSSCFPCIFSPQAMQLVLKLIHCKLYSPFPSLSGKMFWKLVYHGNQPWIKQRLVVANLDVIWPVVVVRKPYHLTQDYKTLYTWKWCLFFATNQSILRVKSYNFFTTFKTAEHVF